LFPVTSDDPFEVSFDFELESVAISVDIGKGFVLALEDLQ